MKLRTLYAAALACSSVLSSFAQDYKAELVEPPVGMKTTTMTAVITSTDFYGQSSSDTYTVRAGNHDGYVYMQGLCPDNADAWIKGKANEAKSQISFSQGQYVGEDFGMQLYFSGFYGKEGSRRDLIVERDLFTGKMKGSQATKYCVYYYDEYSTSSNKYMPWTARYTLESLTPSADWEPCDPKTEPVGPPAPKDPVVAPEGITFYSYGMTAVSERTGNVTHPTQLAFDGEDVYMSGFCRVADQTKALAKGTLKGNTLTFPKEQFVVTYVSDYGSDDMYMYGATYYMGDDDVYLSDFVLTYDSASDTFSAQNDMLVSQGIFTKTGLYSEYLRNVILHGEHKWVTGVSSISAAENAKSAPRYDLQGRSCSGHSSACGLYIQGGKKFIK